MTGASDYLTTGADADSLLGRLLARGFEYEFFHAVWLLERAMPGNVPVGERGPVAQEAFRFRPDVSCGFPASDIRSITPYHGEYDGTKFFQFDVTFLGLYGASTPLPLHYATDILRAVEHGAGTGLAGDSPQGDSGTDTYEASRNPVRDFLDLFHHRLTSLFYRACLKYRYDCSFAVSGRDVMTRYLLWLIGSSPSYDERTLGVTPIRMLRYAGSLTQHPRSAAALEGILVDYWQNYPIRVEQCLGRWVPIAPADQNRLGMRNCSLGIDFSAGEQVYDLNGSFCVSLGPVDWATYLSFLPDGERFAETQSVASMCCSDPLTYELAVTLRAGEVPEMQLATSEAAPRLGFTSWARTDDLPETTVYFPACTGVPPVDATKQSAETEPDAVAATT